MVSQFPPGPSSPSEHYREADRLLKVWATADQGWAIEYGAQLLAAAQAHATLATAEPVYRRSINPPTEEW